MGAHDEKDRFALGGLHGERSASRNFLRRIAHDLHAPLRHVRMLSSFLLEDHTDGLCEEAAADLRTIGEKAAHAERMIDALRQLAELETASLVTEATELGPLLEGCVARVRACHPERSLVLNEVPALNADVDRVLLERLFSELLDNVMRYAHAERAAVRVSYAIEPVPHMRITDDGPGLGALSRYEEAFAPFIRFDPAPESRARLGVGLSVAAAIAGRHGGRLWLEPGLEAGTCACLALPTLRLGEGVTELHLPLPTGTVDTRDGASLAPPAFLTQSTLPPAGEGVRILLIEDSEVDFRAVAQMLNAAKGEYRVDWVRTLSAGLSAIAQNRHDILIVDHYLGSDSGIELLQRAAESGWFGTAILMTGSRSEELALTAVRAGYSDYLCKAELSAARLERTIQYCLERHRRSVELASIAYVDGLTGLLNFRGLEVSARQVLQQAVRTKSRVSLLMLDLDGFKSINDTHGHAAGNVVLREVGRRLRGRLRGSDLVARAGGDEFVVLLSEVAGLEAVEHVVADLTAVVESPIAWEEGPILKVGVSVGYALSDGGQESLTGLMNVADAAMYSEKRARKRRAAAG